MCIYLLQINSFIYKVSEAWVTYKTSQEKSAAREAELIDEIKSIQKTKLTDKQQTVLQFQKLGIYDMYHIYVYVCLLINNIYIIFVYNEYIYILL